MADPQLHIRIPRGLRDVLAVEAEREGVSLNNLIATLLAGAVSWRAPAPEGGRK